MSKDNDEHRHSYSWVVVNTTYGTVVEDGKTFHTETTYSENRCSCGDVDGTKSHTEKR